MVTYKLSPSHKFIFILSLTFIFCSTPILVQAQTQRSPSDVVREFYKAMRERRFKEAWTLTIYKSAVEDLTAQEMEDLLAYLSRQSLRPRETTPNKGKD